MMVLGKYSSKRPEFGQKGRQKFTMRTCDAPNPGITMLTNTSSIPSDAWIIKRSQSTRLNSKVILPIHPRLSTVLARRACSMDMSSDVRYNITDMLIQTMTNLHHFAPHWRVLRPSSSIRNLSAKAAITRRWAPFRSARRSRRRSSIRWRSRPVAVAGCADRPSSRKSSTRPARTCRSFTA